MIFFVTTEPATKTLEVRIKRGTSLIAEDDYLLLGEISSPVTCLHVSISAQSISVHTRTCKMPFKSTQPDISRASLSSRFDNVRLTERSANRYHDLGLAIRFSLLFTQKESVVGAAWLQQCHYRRADQLRSGPRGDDLPFDSVGQQIWAEEGRSSGIV